MFCDRTSTLGLTIAAILAYVNSFGTAFQFDDRVTILEDPRLQSFSSFLEHAAGMIRPLLKLTFVVDRSLYGENPAGYHLLNFLLHCGTGLLLFAVLSIALDRLAASGQRPAVSWQRVPFWTALFFLLHPIQTETVTYISGRATGMAAFFCLLSLYLFLRSSNPDTGRSWIYYAGALLSFVLALASKEIAIIFPCLLFLWHLVFGSKLRRHIPFWAILLLMLISASWHPRYIFLARASLETRPVYENLLTQVNAVSYALTLFFVPSRLNFDHDLPVVYSVVQWPIPACLALLLGLLIAGVLALRRAPLFGFGILWFFVCLVPANSVIPRYDILSERNLYLPSIGIFLAIVVLCSQLAPYLTSRVPRLVPPVGKWACILVVAGLLVATVSRNRVYSDEVSFWSDAVRKSPLKARTHNNLGYAFFQAGQPDGALREFRTALALDPDSASARQNLLRLWKQTRIDD